MLEESNLRVGYMICFVTAVGFVCSLTYNHGYFWLFDAGINILSFGDILASYTLWIPSFGTLIFGYGLDLFLKHIEDEEKSERLKKCIRKLTGVPELILYSAIVILLMSFIIYGYPNSPLLLWFGCFILWLKLSSKIMAIDLFATRMNKYIVGIFLFVPVILSLMFIMGLDKALSDSKLKTPNAFITLINQKSFPAPTILIRHLEKGLLAKDITSNNYMVYAWEDIAKIEIISRNQRFTGIIGIKDQFQS